LVVAVLAVLLGSAVAGFALQRYVDASLGMRAAEREAVMRTDRSATRLPVAPGLMGEFSRSPDAVSVPVGK
jgi:hypothetical protein